jgi:hypothetical protein
VAGGAGLHAHGGASGSQTSSGAGGASADSSDPAGSAGQGGQGGAGAGVAAQNGGGGGGGGGFFGGGGGGGVRSGESAAGGGGGGSDLFSTGAFDVSSSLGSNAGNGQVTLTYTGGPVPALPTGPPGATGAQGPAGPQGPPGPAGNVELVTCTTTSKTVKVHGKPKHVSQKKCSTQLVTTTVKFTTSKLAHVALGRGGLVYAEGTANRVDGIERLTLHARRALPAGRYTLTLRAHPGGSPVRTAIMIS